MKPANKCPNNVCKKCGSGWVMKDHGKTLWRTFGCDSEVDNDGEFTQSNLCRERCKVAKLKKRLKYITDLAWKLRIKNEMLEIDIETLRNPKF